MTITEAQSAAWNEAKGLPGEQDEDCCDHEYDEGTCCGDRPWRRCWKCDQDALDNARDLGSALPAVAFLMALIVSGFLWLALLAAGQAAMCAAHDGLRYCDGYEAQP